MPADVAEKIRDQRPDCRLRLRAAFKEPSIAFEAPFEDGAHIGPSPVWRTDHWTTPEAWTGNLSLAGLTLRNAGSIFRELYVERLEVTPHP